MDFGRRTYKIAEAAKLLGVGRNQAYEAAARGEIPSIRIGKRLLVPKAALDRILDAELDPIRAAAMRPPEAA